MGNIVLLDDLTINQIAAGEVIERPANVVKELVENSIDAGSKNITVEIKKGGKSFIKVIDNGKGIEIEDIPLAFERHATSKIRDISDLENTYSFGFRGEAIASILSISKMTLITRTKEKEIGIKIEAQGGELLNKEDIASQIGTTFIVEDLFYNTPVRFKFLKQDSTEFRYIKEMLQKIALANLDVSISLISDGKLIFKSSGNGSLRDLVYILYGKEIQENLLDVEYEENGITITGVIGNTMIAKDSRKSQIFFLNKRNINNRILTNSSDEAFKGGAGIGKFGFLILNIQMPANLYDVNVHPTKLEVRFKDEDTVYKILYRAIKETLLKAEFLGDKNRNENNIKYVNNELDYVTSHFNNDDNKKGSETDKEKKVDLIKKDYIKELKYKYIGIIFKTFIIIEIDDELYFVDQHAAHERLLYEQIKENYKNNIENNTQMMLMPDIRELSHKEHYFVKKNLKYFTNSGFDIEPFGENSIKINGLPDIEYKANKSDLFTDVLDEMVTNERNSIKDQEDRFIATVACKAAVKANMDLTKEEVDNLLKNLFKLRNPYTCPHGRPTTIKMSKKEIEKILGV